ncbi:MAG: flagellar brake domain-containing protein [Armatimonadetes bacterium]|nr:flagellar brake domain-containing protein [Armatimonadota bacterium]
MPDNLDILLTFLLAVTVSLALTTVVLRFRRSGRAQVLDVPIGANLKLLCPGGAYRCRVLASGPDGILVSAPLHDDRYVPLRPGEHVVGQCGVTEGLLTFHTAVVSRDGAAHTVLLAAAKAYRRSDRREEGRTTLFKGQSFRFGGSSGEIVDSSHNGIRFLTKSDPSPGELIALDLPQGLGEARGFVLDSTPAYVSGGQGRDVRVRLEDAVHGLGPQGRPAVM